MNCLNHQNVTATMTFIITFFLLTRSSDIISSITEYPHQIALNFRYFKLISLLLCFNHNSNYWFPLCHFQGCIEATLSAMSINFSDVEKKDDVQHEDDFIIKFIARHQNRDQLWARQVLFVTSKWWRWFLSTCWSKRAFFCVYHKEGNPTKK